MNAKLTGCGATEAQSILSQVYLLLMGEGCLSDLDDARQDAVFRVLTCSVRRCRLKFSKNLRSVYMKWLNKAMDNTCGLKRILPE